MYVAGISTALNLQLASIFEQAATDVTQGVADIGAYEDDRVSDLDELERDALTQHGITTAQRRSITQDFELQRNKLRSFIYELKQDGQGAGQVLRDVSGQTLDIVA